MEGPCVPFLLPELGKEKGLAEMMGDGYGAKLQIWRVVA